MRHFTSRRPSPAMAVALLALFCSLGGVSYAVATGSINSREIKNNTIRSKDIRNNNVRAKDLRNNDVRTGDLRNNDVRGRDVRNGTLTGGDVGANQLTGEDILESSLGTVFRASGASAVDTLKTSGAPKRVASSASNAVEATARAAATAVPLLTAGPFDLYGKCYTDSNGVGDTGPPDTVGTIFIRTRQNGSVLDAEDNTLDGTPAFLNGATAEASRAVNGAAAGQNDSAGTTSDDDMFSALAPGGTGIAGQPEVFAKNGTLAGGNGIYGAGNACVFKVNAIL